jgi:hypothetical protein
MAIAMAARSITNSPTIVLMRLSFHALPDSKINVLKKAVFSGAVNLNTASSY